LCPAHKSLDFFLQSEFRLFQFGDMQIITAGMVYFPFNLLFQCPVTFAKLSNMRLQSHVQPTFRQVCALSGVGGVKRPGLNPP